MFGARKLQRRSKTRTGANRAALVSGRARYSLLARGQGIRMNRAVGSEVLWVGRRTIGRAAAACNLARRARTPPIRAAASSTGQSPFLPPGGHTVRNACEARRAR